MPNRDKRIRGLIVEWISGVLTNLISIRSLLRYADAENFTNPRDIPDKGYVDFSISQIPSGGKTVINKLGSDVDGSGNLDLSSESGIPANPLFQVYINDLTGYQALNYDKNTMIMGGFGVETTDVIEIIFV